MTGRFRYRVEPFGGLLLFEEPPMQVSVDRAFMRARRLGEAGPARDALWSGEEVDAERAVPRYARPVEAQLALSNACPVACAHCFEGATAAPRPGTAAGLDASAASARRAAFERIDRLADGGVFQIAFGGGEPFLVPWLFEAASHARNRGVVPSVTTSGIGVTEGTAARARVFARVDVSLDAAELRGASAFARADRAIRLLRATRRRVGLNAVLTRESYEELDDLVAYAARRKLDRVQLLRLKPTGRARAIYHAHRTTDAQNRSLYARLKRLARHRVRLAVDCSLAPMLAAGGADAATMARLGVAGCHGGDALVSIDASGRAHPCSFVAGDGWVPVEALSRWRAPETFAAFRSAARAPRAPCDRCEHRTICRGGCRSVAEFLTGDPGAPDPECPLVIDRDRSVV